jgi:DNA-nicking Smr family endonuclease
MSAGIVCIDVHGMNRYQSKIKIDSVLKKADRGVYSLCIIHGFHSGTAIKDMIAEEYAAHPKVLRIVSGNNSGQTELILREL